MFSSIASFIFGSNTSATTSPDPTEQQQPETSTADNHVCIQPEHTVEVTSLTPSVTGTSNAYRGGKRGKGHKRQRQQQHQLQQQQANKNKRQAAPKKATPSLTKLLTPSGESFDSEDRFDEDDWFIVEKEEEDHDEERSLPRTDSEDDVPVVEVAKPKPNDTYAAVVSNGRNPNNNNNGSRRRATPHITSHSLYNGPRVQPPPRAGRPGPMSLARANSPIDNVAGVTQSLYVASHETHGPDSFGPSHGANAMEESWFVTPPPCFTSIGPIHMETSPFENLLIEHPSMSVYHSIRSAQEATESFVNLDLGVEESQQANTTTTPSGNTEPMATGDEEQAATVNEGAVVPRRTAGARIDRYSAAQLKQELMARNTQKNRVERERQNLCRSAIKRSNQVRDFQSKGNRQRRSDMQHCKVVSGANNNRKCCF